MKIPKKIKTEIEEYCKINGIEDIETFILENIKVGFNIEKYGNAPFVQEIVVEKEVPVETIKEMILTYEKLSSLLNKELILCPADYPYLYNEINKSNIFLGEKRHWRKIDQTLCSFVMSKKIIENYSDDLISMCKFEHYPFEKPLHKIYKKELCISPIPSLSVHFTNINSIYGLSPNIDWKKLWEENES